MPSATLEIIMAAVMLVLSLFGCSVPPGTPR